MSSKLQVKVRAVSGTEYAARIAGQKMSEGEKAARLYLGKKQIERNLRIDRCVIAALIGLMIGGLVLPFALIWGV